MQITKYFLILLLIAITWPCKANNFLKYCDPNEYLDPSYDDDFLKPKGKYKDAQSEQRSVILIVKSFEGITPFYKIADDYFFGSRMKTELLGYCNDPYFAKIKYHYGAQWTGVLYTLTDSQTLPLSFPEFRDLPIEFYGNGEAQSPIGVITYHNFVSSGGLGCVVFDHVLWYENLNRGVAIEGYYCNRNGKILSRDEIQTFFTGLHVKGFDNK